MAFSPEILAKFDDKTVPLRVEGGQQIGTATTRVEDGKILVDCEIDVRLTYMTEDTGFTLQHKFSFLNYDLEGTDGK